MMKTGEHGHSIAGDSVDSWMEIVRGRVESLSFGVVQIVVHDGRVVQIERTEKVRLETPLRSQAQNTNFAGQTSGGMKRNIS